MKVLWGICLVSLAFAVGCGDRGNDSSGSESTASVSTSPPSASQSSEASTQASDVDSAEVDPCVEQYNALDAIRRPTPGVESTGAEGNIAAIGKGKAHPSDCGIYNLDPTTGKGVYIESTPTGEDFILMEYISKEQTDGLGLSWDYTFNTSTGDIEPR